MPRNYSERDEAGECEARDYCIDCWENAEGYGPDDEDDHPDYRDMDYRCCRCERRLTSADN